MIEQWPLAPVTRGVKAGQRMVSKTNLIYIDIYSTEAIRKLVAPKKQI